MNETVNQSRNQKAAYAAAQTDSKVDEALQKLIQALHESQEYTSYQKIRTKVHEYPELEEQIHAYRKKNYEVQNAGNLDLYEETERLEREGADFRKIPLVREYLAAELALCRVFKHINWSIIQNIDFDLGFITE